VPQVAVINDAGGRYVLLVDDQNNVSRANIELGERLDGGRQVVRSGLNGGERIIIEGVQKVRPNTPVTAMTREQYNQMIQQQQGAAGGR
jgi:membrane fusion protein (multidrug efflux system)